MSASRSDLNLAREGDHLLITNYETWLNASFNEPTTESAGRPAAPAIAHRRLVPTFMGLAVLPPEQFQEVVVVFLGHVFTSPRFQT